MRKAFDGRNVIVSVDTFNGKDAALNRLHEKFPFIEKSEWDYLDSIDPDKYFIGAIGQHISL